MTDPNQIDPGARGVAERLEREHLRIVAAGDEDAVAVRATADYFNHRSADEPMGARQR